MNATADEPATAGRLIQAAWLGSVLILVGVTAVGMPIGYRRPELLAVAEFTDLLDNLGVPVWFAITLGLVLPVVSATILAGLVWRGRRTDPMALLLSLGLLGLFVFSSRSTFLITAEYPELRPLMLAVDVLSIVPLVFLVFLYPTGTFKPRWGRLVAYGLSLVVIVRPSLGQTVGSEMADIPVAPLDRFLTLAVFAALILTGTVAQVIRYRRYSTAHERTQARWAFFMLGLLMVFAFLTFATLSAGVTPPRWAIWIHLLAASIGAISPLTLGVGLFRYHLYDLDGIISRTVTYALVIGLLAAVYAGATVLMTEVLPLDSTLAVAASTLAAAALFTPLRRQVRKLVDRRFNRTRYQAEKEVEAFTTRLRDTTDIDTVQADLVDVISRTLQPSTVGVWIKGQDG